MLFLGQDEIGGMNFPFLGSIKWQGDLKYFLQILLGLFLVRSCPAVRPSRVIFDRR